MRINPNILVYLPAKGRFSGGGLRCYFLKGTSNAKEMESNLQFQSVQLDRESTDTEKDNYTGIDDDFVAECSSAENSKHTPAPSDTFLSDAQRRTRPRIGKHPVEEGVIGKNLV
jgi:hypothetical protein